MGPDSLATDWLPADHIAADPVLKSDVNVTLQQASFALIMFPLLRVGHGYHELLGKLGSVLH